MSGESSRKAQAQRLIAEKCEHVDVRVRNSRLRAAKSTFCPDARRDARREADTGPGGWRLEFVRGSSGVPESHILVSPQFKSIMPIARQIVLAGLEPVARVFSFIPNDFVFGLG